MEKCKLMTDLLSSSLGGYNAGDPISRKDSYLNPRLNGIIQSYLNPWLNGIIQSYLNPRLNGVIQSYL